MNRIYAIGETVFDLVFRNHQPLSAKAGGSMLNTSVSLGRIGLPVSLITEIGEDRVGNYIFDFLNKNNVDTDYIVPFNDGKTAIALAFLDERDNAEYSFYKNYPEERLTIDFPKPEKGDIVLFGSFFAITSEVRRPLMKFIQSAIKNGSIIIYDPNFRRPHLKDLPFVKDMIIENIKFSSMVRGSDEDFELIFGFTNADETFEKLDAEGCHFLVYTNSSRSVEFRSSKFKITLDVHPVKPVSTIGAGDSFNAGLMYYLFTSGINANDLNEMNEMQWREALKIAISFGSHVCQHIDNYISYDFASQF